MMIGDGVNVVFVIIQSMYHVNMALEGKWALTKIYSFYLYLDLDSSHAQRRSWHTGPLTDAVAAESTFLTLLVCNCTILFLLWSHEINLVYCCHSHVLHGPTNDVSCFLVCSSTWAVAYSKVSDFIKSI